jgi:hypothetical protein
MITFKPVNKKLNSLNKKPQIKENQQKYRQDVKQVLF